MTRRQFWLGYFGVLAAAVVYVAIVPWTWLRVAVAFGSVTVYVAVILTGSIVASIFSEHRNGADATGPASTPIA